MRLYRDEVNYEIVSNLLNSKILKDLRRASKAEEVKKEHEFLTE
ncbi:MAG: hypothetical protein ACXABI_10275 [Candidatus Hodarchaeales archaeon]|jgi:hypothetical protein